MLIAHGVINLKGAWGKGAGVATVGGGGLAESRIPKLFINAEPGAILTGRQREFCRTWRNQTELTVEGIHFIQEDSPEKIGEALVTFVRSLRSLSRTEKVEQAPSSRLLPEQYALEFCTIS